MARKIVAGEGRLFFDGFVDLIDPLVSGFLNEPASAFFHIAIPIDGRTCGEEVKVEYPHVVGQVPDAGRLGLAENLNFRVVTVVMANRLAREGLLDRGQVLLTAL